MVCILLVQPLLMLVKLQICGDDEYEKFSLPTPERCLLGRNVTSTRRKADSECFNGKAWQREQGWDEYCDCDWVRSIVKAALKKLEDRGKNGYHLSTLWMADTECRTMGHHCQYLSIIHVASCFHML